MKQFIAQVNHLDFCCVSKKCCVLFYFVEKVRSIRNFKLITIHRLNPLDLFQGQGVMFTLNIMSKLWSATIHPFEKDINNKIIYSIEVFINSISFHSFTSDWNCKNNVWTLSWADTFQSSSPLIFQLDSKEMDLNPICHNPIPSKSKMSYLCDATLRKISGPVEWIDVKSFILILSTKRTHRNMQLKEMFSCRRKSNSKLNLMMSILSFQMQYL